MGTHYFPVRKAAEGKQQPGEKLQGVVGLYTYCSEQEDGGAVCSGGALCPGHMVDKKKVSE